MNREEILEKSRQAQDDEGMRHAENEGRKIGFIVSVLLFTFLAVFDLFFGGAVAFYALSSLFWVVLSAEAYGKYRFSKNKIYLVTAIAGIIASLAFAANYVLNTLR